MMKKKKTSSQIDKATEARFLSWMDGIERGKRRKHKIKTAFVNMKIPICSLESLSDSDIRAEKKGGEIPTQEALEKNADF